MTRGTSELLLNGRDFYSLDRFKIPTKAAWRVREWLWLGSNHEGGR